MDQNVLEPHVFIIFGATGDLTARKLIPAYYHVLQRTEGRKGIVIGTARSEMTDEEFREIARKALKAKGIDDSTWCDQCVYFSSLGREHKDYSGLCERVEDVEKRHGLSGNRVFYLALPPVAFKPTITGIDESGLKDGDGWSRLVVEKPFGKNLETAQELNDFIHERFDESEVYRIDHYLGKQTVQNLLALRFANPIFESVWNRDRVESVEITVSESLGLGSRAGYYDKAGAMRDMIQNHLTQLVTLVAMEPPASFRADAIRREKIKVLNSIQPVIERAVVLGQYTSGTVDGESVPGYREESEATEASNTETFVALRLDVSNWRWQGVPFFLRTGKRMPRRRTRINVRFRRAPISIFQPYADHCNLTANELIVELQPDEGFHLKFEVKTPREPFELSTQTLSFDYDDTFGEPPDGYETLLQDIVQGDQTLFVHAEEAEMAWRIYDPVINAGYTVHPYEAGTWGPDEIGNLYGRWGNDDA